jgi:Flp pilus assembly protein CpaB
MRKFTIVMLAVAAGVFAAPAIAASSNEATSSGQDEAQGDEDYMNEVVCRRDVQIGSRVQRRRTCMTRREQIRLQNETRSNMNEFLNRANSNPPPQ